MLSFVLVLLSQVLQCFVDRVGVTSVFTVVTSGVRVQISKTIQVVTMNLQTHEDIRKIPLQKESGKQKQTKEHETWEPKGSQRLLFVVSRSCQTKILVTFKVMFSSVSKSCGGGGGGGGRKAGLRNIGLGCVVRFLKTVYALTKNSISNLECICF